LAAQLLGQELVVEGLEAFAGGQAGVFEEAGDLALETVVGLGLEQVGEEALVAPVFGFGALDGLVVLAGGWWAGAWRAAVSAERRRS